MAHTPRIYTAETLSTGLELPLLDKTHHHLAHVMRAKVGDALVLFNSTQGAYTAELVQLDKKRGVALVKAQLQEAETPAPIILCPCLIKPARFDWVLEKATELGVQAIQPILSDYTDINKLNLERAAGIVQSAVEQSGRTYMPQLCAPQKLVGWLSSITAGTILWAHENAQMQNMLPLLQQKLSTPIYLLAGPEGGFSSKEQDILSAHKFVQTISLGTYILRAETASLSLLSVVAQLVNTH